MGINERRERERQRRRADIIRAAAEVFAERGLESASMDAIASRAELGKATLYYYFPNKKALFDAVLASGIKQFLLDLDAEGPDTRDLPSAVESILRAYVTFFQANRPLMHLLAPHLVQLNLRPQGEGETRDEGLPATLLVPQQLYLARMDELLSRSPWSERRHAFMAFIADVVLVLSQLVARGMHEEAEERVAFYVDLVRGRLAAGD